MARAAADASIPVKHCAPQVAEKAMELVAIATIGAIRATFCVNVDILSNVWHYRQKKQTAAISRRQTYTFTQMSNADIAAVKYDSFSMSISIGICVNYM